jgi:FkbM family methyltransferase
MTTFYSQHGEDSLLSKIFGIKTGTCVEVGANDGVTFSNTLHFEQQGWTCVLVEPTPRLCTSIRRTRHSKLFECAASFGRGEAVLNVADGLELYSSVEKTSTMAHAIAAQARPQEQIRVPTRTLDDMLDEAGVRSVDFVTIDVEGHELSVLKGFTISRWQPRVVIVEDNTDLKDTPVCELMRRAGYVRFYRSGGNDWYASKSDRQLTSLWHLLLSSDWTKKGLLKAWLPPAARNLLLSMWRTARA